jgi:NADPH-dependent curcumin reductase
MAVLECILGDLVKRRVPASDAHADIVVEDIDSDAVLRNLALGARIVICGTASYPSWNPWNMGPRPERHLLVKRSRMQGFLATDFLDRFPEAEVQISQWIKGGHINYREEIHEGLEHAPGSLQRLYKGENTGKFVMRLPAVKT